MNRFRDIVEVNTINFSVLGVVHLADIKEVLSVILIVVTIGYTLWKWKTGRKD
jgi:hypothetical protein